MSALNECRETLESLDAKGEAVEMRLAHPDTLRIADSTYEEAGRDGSENRAYVQELMDYVPPFDQKKLDEAGEGDRFNVNFGLAAATKNEAVGALLDIFTAPTKLIELEMDYDYEEEDAAAHASIMSTEFTRMIRAWDQSLPKMFMVADIDVTHGVAVTWFNDHNTMDFNVASLEEARFDSEAEAIPSKVELMTVQKKFTISELWSIIEGHEDEEEVGGWSVSAIKAAILKARPKGVEEEGWNMERANRMIKANRFSSAAFVPTVEVIYGFVREMNGKLTMVACTKEIAQEKEKKSGEVGINEKEEWLFKAQGHFNSADQSFQIFTFSIGNKNLIHTIRGLGYFLYEAGNADNILRCKMLDAARFRSSEVYESSNEISSIEDVQFIEIGNAIIAPKALSQRQQAPNTQKLSDSIGFAVESVGDVINKHSAGLAGALGSNNPSSRRNQLEISLEAEQQNKLQSFAISLYYAPYEKLIKQLAERAFTKPQKSLELINLVKEMKECCERQGVPKEAFSKISWSRSRVTRVVGAGSRSSRIMGYTQMSQLFSSMDEAGQKYFSHDWASEMQGADKANRYFGKPDQQRSTMDEQIAELENNDLREGQFIAPNPSENKMVHLRVHITDLHEEMGLVNKGEIDLSEWTTENVGLYKHIVDTLETTTVAESLVSQFNRYKQQAQQIGEVIENGMRHINKMKELEAETAAANGGAPGSPGAPAEVDEQGNPISPELSAAKQDMNLKNAIMVAESNAKIGMMQQTNNAKIALDQQKAMAAIQLDDMETAAKIKRSR